MAGDDSYMESGVAKSGRRDDGDASRATLSAGAAALRWIELAAKFIATVYAG
jgi:hypothetical protein